MKKRKLNSKNPKYWDKSLLNEKPIKKRNYCAQLLTGVKCTEYGINNIRGEW